MKKQTGILIAWFLPFISLAQVSSKKNFAQQEAEQSKICGGMDFILSIKGKWKKETDDFIFPDKTFPKNQYQYLTARTDSIHLLVKQTITDLSGLEPYWHTVINGQSYISGGAVPYQYNSRYHDYYCNQNLKKILLSGETGTWIYVFVNRLSWFMYEVDTLDINDDGKIRTVYRLPPKIGKWKGFDVYELNISTWFTSRSIILGRNGKVPWRSLTQKQYLTGLKNSYQKQITMMKKGSWFESDLAKRLQYITDYLLRTGEETLQQPVIIDPKSGIWGFNGKFGDEEAGGFRLVLSGLGEKYFDKSLPRYVPQLIQLYWSYGYTSPEQNFKKQFEENFPLEKLKAMIDK